MEEGRSGSRAKAPKQGGDARCAREGEALGERETTSRRLRQIDGSMGAFVRSRLCGWERAGPFPGRVGWCGPQGAFSRPLPSSLRPHRAASRFRLGVPSPNDHSARSGRVSSEHRITPMAILPLFLKDGRLGIRLHRARTEAGEAKATLMSASVENCNVRRGEGLA
ncbi:hypothetical protein HPB50_016497 [Hyalomma asiaticum]|uniref:Uncharacterized protein n=1 Tax=Hyalomma asiaticum TaxID=266040 RepID=A0ACB7T2R6_HYAAI|nr:hypothetical protein HPB50_016497 [Hyalomma asiaticum]